MVDRCLYEPTESGHCVTCGAAYPLTCPFTGGVLVQARHGRLVSLGDALKPVLARIGDLIERTVDDDRP